MRKDTPFSCWVWCTKKSQQEREEKKEEEEGDGKEERKAKEAEEVKEEVNERDAPAAPHASLPSSVNGTSSDADTLPSVDEERRPREGSGALDHQSSSYDSADDEDQQSGCDSFEDQQCICRGKARGRQAEDIAKSGSVLSGGEDEAKGKRRQCGGFLHGRDSQGDASVNDRQSHYNDRFLERQDEYNATLQGQYLCSDTNTDQAKYKHSPDNEDYWDFDDEISVQDQTQCDESDFPYQHDASEYPQSEHECDFEGDETKNRQSTYDECEHRHWLCYVSENERGLENKQLQQCSYDDHIHDTAWQHMEADLYSLHQAFPERYVLKPQAEDKTDCIDSEDNTDYIDHVHQCISSNNGIIRQQKDTEFEELQSQEDAFKDQESESSDTEDAAEFSEHVHYHSFSNDSAERRLNYRQSRDKHSQASDSETEIFGHRDSECNEPLHHCEKSSDNSTRHQQDGGEFGDKESDKNSENDDSTYSDFVIHTEYNEYFHSFSSNDSRIKHGQKDKLEEQTFRDNDNKSKENQCQYTKKDFQKTKYYTTSKRKQMRQSKKSSGNCGAEKNGAEAAAVGHGPSILLSRTPVEVTVARPFKILFKSGILEVESNRIVGRRAKVFFQRDVLYLNQKKVEEGKSLSVLLQRQRDRHWGCVARPFPRKKNGAYRKVDGVEVQLIASLVWIGDRPSLADTKKPEAKKVYQAKKLRRRSKQNMRRSSEAGDPAKAREGRVTQETVEADGAAPKDVSINVQLFLL